MDSWLGVEIRHLAALAAIDAERSFRGAAERLGYVQSAVSAQISRLERLVGVRLVDRARGHSRVQLTADGRLLLEHAQRVLAQLQAAHADLQAWSTGAGGTLRVGAFQSVATRILPAALARLAVNRTDVRVVTSEGPTDEDHFAAIERGELDATFAELPLEPGPFEVVELLRDPFVLLVHADSELACHETPVTLRTVVELALVTHPAWRMTPLIDEHLRATGKEPQYRFQSDTNSAIQALVSTGLAAAILPRLAVDQADRATAVVELDSPLAGRIIGLCRHRERVRQPAFDAFVEAVRAACRDVLPAERGLRSERGRPLTVAA